MNSLAQVLDLVDENSTVTLDSIEGNIKHITVTKNVFEHYCPNCSHRLESQGDYIRKPNHSILQDGYILKLTLKGKRWRCPNCKEYSVDSFNFILPHKKTTQIIELQILRTLKDIKLDTRQVAERFNVSDTYVHQLFMKYVDLPRLPLTESIAIDEVYLNLDYDCKYAMIIMDFNTGNIIDILPSRRKVYTEEYFLHIPLEERKKVKYLICDMYSPYINYTKNYFPNATAITDSFHVLQWLLNLIGYYIRKVKNKYQEKDRKRLEEKNYLNNSDNKTIKDSKEVYILKHATWVMLKKRSSWDYNERHYNRHLDMYMDTYDWEREFLKLDDNFKAIRDLKDLYEYFNEDFINKPQEAAESLNQLIDLYKESQFDIFRQFAGLLEKYHESIINSFNYIQDARSNDTTVLRRMSNGPLESFNNIPSAYRSQSHGVKNFDYTRNRILWAVRDNAAILGTPKTVKQIHKNGKKRGKYKKEEQ